MAHRQPKATCLLKQCFFFSANNTKKTDVPYHTVDPEPSTLNMRLYDIHLSASLQWYQRVQSTMRTRGVFLTTRAINLSRR